MKKFLLAALLSTPLFFACEKESVLSKPGKTPVTENTKTMHCYPWRDVYGYTSLCSELNVFAVCGFSDCTGSSIISTATSGVLKDPSGNDYLFSSDEEISVAKQNEIRSQASIWATAYTPAAGYFVSAITYQVPPGEWTTNATGIGIIVTYRKCTGGGGGEHS